MSVVNCATTLEPVVKHPVINLAGSAPAIEVSQTRFTGFSFWSATCAVRERLLSGGVYA